MRRAKRIYERQVAPILAAAGLDVTAVETVRRGHAGKLAVALDLRQCDLLVLVGGDGTVFDALQVPCTARQYGDSSSSGHCLQPAKTA